MAILGCTVLSAVLTPTPDAYNMGLMAMPLLALYAASWLVTALFGRKKGASAGEASPGEPAG
jgi:sec-independent protein translocase protein TatC